MIKEEWQENIPRRETAEREEVATEDLQRRARDDAKRNKIAE